jgi:HlyD family secretion protein
MKIIQNRPWMSVATKPRRTGLMLLLSDGMACHRAADSASPPPVVKATPIHAVVALGRLVPDVEIMKVSVLNAQDGRFNQIFVKAGDRPQ